MFKAIGSAVLGITLLAAAGASAAPVTFDFEARVTGTADRALFGGLIPNDTFTGSYTFDPNTPATVYSNATQYEMAGTSSTRLTINIGSGFVFDAFTILIRNDDFAHITPDVYRLFTPDGAPSKFYFELASLYPNGSALTSTSLPVHAPDLFNFDAYTRGVLSTIPKGSLAYYDLSFDIISLTDARPIPEPNPLGVMVVGLVTIVVFRRQAG